VSLAAEGFSWLGGRGKFGRGVSLRAVVSGRRGVSPKE